VPELKIVIEINPEQTFKSPLFGRGFFDFMVISWTIECKNVKTA
jgi:hypothetical protein